MDDIVFITGNQAKADYLEKWLGHPVSHQKLDLDELQSLEPRDVIAHKAKEAYKIVGRPVLVEDVALSCKAFGGRLPGTLIKWFLEEIGNDGILKMLEGFEDRTATASIIYGIYDGNQLYSFEGRTAGRIAEAVRTSASDGWHGSKSWNGIFIPDGSDKTYAEMTDEELQPFSHRYKAIVKLREYLVAQVPNA